MPTSAAPAPRLARRLCAVAAAFALGLSGSAALVAPAEAHSGRAHGNRAVALGDSYASGEGIAPYRAGTDTATNQCHRSVEAYPELLTDGRRPALKRVRSVACSGAGTGALVADLPDRSSEPPQLDALRRSTKRVTLTIGGNDLGFSQVLGSCVYTPVNSPELQRLVPGRPGCRAQDAFVVARTARLAGAGTAAQFPGTLTMAEALLAIHSRSPRARVYVTGYPRLIGLTGFDAFGCRVGTLGPAPLYVTSLDVDWLRKKVDELNAAIQAGVATARSQGVRATYVDVATPFTTHNVCGSGTPWVNGVVFTATNPPQLSIASFHPNARGQQAYADAVAAAIRADSRRRN
nr:SGNH/GDSL hydrolase family protein [uncultured Friedmanniella sp.]